MRHITPEIVEGAMQRRSLRYYFLLQQLHSRYCLASADEIRYADAQGRLHPTTEAVASGVFRRSQLVTRYSDGTVTAVNGSKDERMKVNAFGREVDLPPNGFAGWTRDGQIEVMSADGPGHRCDYAATPAYLFVDGRGGFARFAKAAGNGLGVCRILGRYEPHVVVVDLEPPWRLGSEHVPRALELRPGPNASVGDR